MNEKSKAIKSDDDCGDRYTLENRLDDLKYSVTNVSILSGHIHGILFGNEIDSFCEEKEDRSPSIVSTLYEIEEQVKDAWKVLEEIASALSNSKRLTVNR